MVTADLNSCREEVATEVGKEFQSLIVRGTNEKVSICPGIRLDKSVGAVSCRPAGCRNNRGPSTDP